MIEITVLLSQNEVRVKKFDGEAETITTDDKIKYWDIIAEYCECADKCGIIPKISIYAK